MGRCYSTGVTIRMPRRTRRSGLSIFVEIASGLLHNSKLFTPQIFPGGPGAQGPASQTGCPAPPDWQPRTKWQRAGWSFCADHTFRKAGCEAV